MEILAHSDFELIDTEVADLGMKTPQQKTLSATEKQEACIALAFENSEQKSLEINWAPLKLDDAD